MIFNWLFSMTAFLLAIAILIIVHEFGHFWVARRLGVKVLRYSVGFGKALWSRRDRKGTEYVIAMLPIGGYVKLLDEREGVVAQHDLKYAFNRQPVWKRIAIVCAGPFFNIILAFVIYWVIFSIGVTTIAPFLGKIHPQSIASASGFMKGDEIVGINGKPIDNWREVQLALLMDLDGVRAPSIVVRRNHHLKTLTLSGDFKKLKTTDVFDGLGVEPYIPPIPPVIGEVIANSPAKKGGLQKDDRILRIGGYRVIDWQDFAEYARVNPGHALMIEVKRGHSTQVVTIRPILKKTALGEQGFVGIKVKEFDWPEKMLRKQHYSPWKAWQPAAQETWTITQFTAKMLGRLFTGQFSWEGVAGPIGIAKGAGQSATLGVIPYLSFLAIISISLGVLNLLPIPALDGGYILYYLIELVLRRPIPDYVQEIGFRIGLCILLMIMVIAFYNDIGHLLM